MKNFYDETIEKIKEKIKEKKYFDALKIVEEELKMPYIPTKIEEELIKFKVFLKSKQVSNNSWDRKIDVSNILKLINEDKLNDFEKYDSIELLSDFNLRNYIDEIQEVLLENKIKDFIKLKLINELKKQGLNNKIQILLNNEKVEINLNNFIEISKNSDFNEDLKKIKDFLFKEPILSDIALNLLEKIYLTNIYSKNQKNEEKLNDLWLETIYIAAKFLNYKEILDEIESLINDKNCFSERVLDILKNANFT